jgi:hypothetical protein
VLELVAVGLTVAGRREAQPATAALNCSSTPG